MDNSIFDYLEHHRILAHSAPGFVVADAIVDNPAEFIEVVKQSGCYISEIIIWDRVPIGADSQIGYGGPPDPRAAGQFYFSESFLSSEFDEGTDASEYHEFVQRCIDQYPNCDLHPGFTVKYCGV